MKAIGIGLASIGVLLTIACGDADNDSPTPRCDASSCPGGGAAGVGGSGAAGANGSGGAGAGGRGGAGGSSGALGGTGGTTNPDGGGRGGSSAGGTAGANGSAGSAVMDAALDRDASRDASGDTAEDADGRQCLEPSRIPDSGTCTHSACRRGTTIEISATNTEVWRVGALFWVMTVCDISANESGQANQYRTLIFNYTEADWARMREGDPVSMHYGRPAAVNGVPCGRLTKTIQNCPP